MAKRRNPQIRNSTAEFLIFTNQSGEDTIEVRIQDNTVWLTQKLIAALFEVDRSVITKHLTNIYQEGELSKEATSAIYAQVQTEGNRQVNRDIEFYNLDAIISIGYRVNSKRATAFRQWATSAIESLAKKGIYTGVTLMPLLPFINDTKENVASIMRQQRMQERLM